MWKRLALNYIIRWIILSYHGSKVSSLDSLDCDFEQGFCNWVQRQNDGFDWKVGTTSTNNRSPNGDHTTGDGFYAYIDTDDLENNGRALLASTLQTNGTYCFSLWYYMYGTQIVTLTVFQNQNGKRTNIFETNSSQEQRWMLKAINISSTSEFKILIRGRVDISESRVSGVVAVDDILMLSGNCPSECDDPTPTNGYVDSEIFKLGSVVGIACMSGYTLIGRSSITCLENGTWSGKSECHLIECSNPVPENGMSNSTKFRYGSVVKITCNDGYKISGISVIYCQANRNWTATPTCSIIDCLIPEIANGNMSGPRNNTTYNHTVNVVCEDDYDLVGNEIITCQADGYWSALPICILHADDQTESVNKNVLTAIYVTVPLVVVALIIVVTTIIWRQYFAVRRSHGQVKKEQPQPKTLFTNMAYSECFNEILPKNGDALSQDDEYAVITDDRHEMGQSKTTEYSNVVTVIKDTEHSYDHMKKSGMSIIDNTYSHITGNKSMYTSSNITTESSLSGNASYQFNTRHNIDNCDLRKPKEPRKNDRFNLQSNMLDEQESEYDHAQAGGTNPPDTDDYTHLNVGEDKSKSECSEIKHFTVDTCNGMYCNVMEQTKRPSIEYDYAYEKPIGETPEYFVLEPKSVDTAEDGKD